MMVQCEICRISLSENDLPYHTNGKRHLKNLVRYQSTLKPVGKTISNTPSENEEASKPKEDTKDPISVKKLILPSCSKEKDDSITVPTKTIDSETSNTNDSGTKRKELTPDKRNQDISKRRQKRKLKEETPRTPSIPFVYINNLVSFDHQVINFVMQVEQTQNEWVKIKWVLQDVEFTFGHVIPGVKPVLYGSSFSGLAFKTSDIDVYLYDSRGGEPDRAFIQRDGGIIYRFRLFNNIIRIPNARVPVIKATHIGTGIDLDISATSGQAVANSRMIRFLLSHDWRIRSLMMLIGYLGKKYTLIGVNKFSRYSINLLIIFYLQNLALPILPPLSQIVYGATGRTWPFAFKENNFLLINNNKQQLAELFMGFFEFFVDFTFSKYVISTYLGEKIPEEDMEKEDILDKMVYYKNFIEKGGDKIVYRSICVQDPLELSHNTTKGITEKVLSQFKFICTNALQIKQTVDERDWLIEMLKMEYIPPFIDKVGNGPIPFEVKYDFEGDDWISSVKQSLELVFSTLGMDIDWNYPVVEDDTKKTKLSPGLTFSVETRKFIFPKGLKWSINQLKAGNYNLKELNKSLMEISETKHQTVFCAQCFVSLDQPKLLRITMKNNCTHRMFYRMFPILRSTLELLLNHAFLEINKTSNDSKSTE
ncbi:speckle targeted PIP5K1A-regulated poly(A) polymerase isoform X2 [Halyomorpha halys]|uniref:speckle targeted PIP5K1A-regulated poly(A) polymerase isoform X2 n=1 Tax=Halyomorpha halys TaxID=286706 RepID=UPI000D0C7B53|nr:speckle targeted PIP5K1A-regulated poly(A) polymerase isoform X2 [Halyomorpha halys]